MDTNGLITLNVTYSEANVIVQGLAKLPYEIAHPLISNLQAQAAPQITSQPTGSPGAE